MRSLSGLSLAIQNCNSLNLSTYRKTTPKCDFNIKLNSILSANADITLLIDIRAQSDKFKLISNYIKCTNKGNFKIIFNSNSSQKRGVAIIYKDNLDLIVEDYFRSVDFNILLINVRLKGLPVTIGAIYGPTDTEDEEFFSKLKDKVCDFGHPSFILGGDFNAVTCITKPSISYINQNRKRQKYYNSNPEVLNMPEIPNRKHSTQICKIIDEGFWIDPFRLLNSDVIEFSYVPKQYGARNRSRIDFFLTSPYLLGIISKIEYVPTITQFDHKLCLMNFNISNSIKPPIIDNNLLSIPGIIEISRLEALQLLSIHGDIVSNNIIVAYSQVTNKICDLTIFLREKNITDSLLIAIRSSLLLRANDIFSNLPIPFEDLFNQDIDIMPSLFLETLQNNVKLSIVNFQKKYKKAENKFLNSIKTQLVQMKSNQNSLCDDIFDLEAKYTKLCDEKNLRICEKSRSWRALHLEKASRPFCNLAKAKKKQESLSVIKDTSVPGMQKLFLGQAERSEYISDFYKKIYTKGMAVDHNIHDFLGPDICNSEYVTSKKLTEGQRESLESDISLIELDESIKKSNKHSAPGRDGWSFCSVAKLWEIFRKPLKNAFNHMIETGSLDFSFKEVSVKLIPKKGDLSELKNWRPISLLSVFYKLPASAFARRLRKYFDQIVSVRQKAYSHSKVIQECVMSVIDNISKCLSNNSNAALILIDFTKAFDRISHDFVSSVLRFFNFGPKMLKIAKTLLSGRCGSIITEAGLSPSFPFNSGTGQGAPESCYFFVIALEILLIKLKLCPTLERVTVPLPDNSLEELEGVGFADDLTEILVAHRENIVNLKSILNSFFRISDLEVNMSKTVVIPLAQADNEEFRIIIENEGLSHDDSFKLLGFNLNNRLDNFGKNIDDIIEKLTRIFAFWDKFNLTLPGRIMVFKTYVLSCIGYICTIIPTPPSRTNLMDRMVYRFVTKNINIKEDVVFRPAEQGGLGLIRSSHFIQALRVGIFRRSLSINDSWSNALKKSTRSTNPFWLDCTSPWLAQNPSAKLIAHSLSFFYYAYLRTKGNVKYAPIFDNLSLLRMPNGNPLTFDQVFNHDLTIDEKRHLSNIKFIDCIDTTAHSCHVNTMIENVLNLQLTRAQYFIIRNFIQHNIESYHNARRSDSMDINAFFSRIKRGSRLFREIISKDRLGWKESIPLGKRFTQLNAIPENDNPFSYNKKRDSLYLAIWNNHFIWNFMKDTFVKYINNRLLFNRQLAKKNPLLNSTCSICRANRAANIEKEDIYHLIFRCQYYKPVTQSFVNSINPLSPDFKATNILIGVQGSTQMTSFFVNILCLVFINYTYSYRNKLPVPTPAAMNLYMARAIWDFSLVSNKFRMIVDLIRNMETTTNMPFF